jgi:sporulation protein YlmC with PRC-barrel domain
MRLEEVWGRAVFDRSTAQELGTVVGFVVDADEHRVIAIDVGCDEPCVVGWDSVVGIGDGGVIVTSKEAVREPKETEHARLAAGRQLIGKRVLTSEGKILGELDELIFDPRTGVVERLVIAGGEVEGDHLRAVGSYALVVQ